MTGTDQLASGGGRDVEALAKNFDIWDPALNEDPYPALHELQAGCPVARSEALGGYWFVSSYDGVRDVFTNPSVFSSRILQIPPPAEPPVLIPETLDPPVHNAYRQLMAPLLSPPAVAAMEASTRAKCQELLEPYLGTGGGDFVEAVALPLPAFVFLSLLGLPWEDLPFLLEYRDALMRGMVSKVPEEVTAAHETIGTTAVYFGRAIAARRQMDDPPADLLTALVTGTVAVEGGRSMSDEEIINTLFLLVSAGLDTVTATLAKVMYSLAQRPDLRQQLIDDPSLLPGAVEEFLRYWSLVSTCREARTDTVFHGRSIKAGDIINVCTPAASRDPKEFDRPDELDFRRTENRHLAFGAGPHRCVGSHLARMELTVALDEILRHMPSFKLDPDRPSVHRFGQVIGVDLLPLIVPDE